MIYNRYKKVFNDFLKENRYTVLINFPQKEGLDIVGSATILDDKDKEVITYNYLWENKDKWYKDFVLMIMRSAIKSALEKMELVKIKMKHTDHSPGIDVTKYINS